MTQNGNAGKRVVLIGSGNVAWHLGHALRSGSYSVVAVVSRNEGTGTDLAEALHCRFERFQKGYCPDADLVLIAVSDASLEGVASLLSPGEAIVVHTAGSMPMQVLSGHATRYGVCYPFQTLTRGVPVNFSEVPLLLEASSDEVLAHVEHLARELSSCVYRITSEQRKLLHLAGIMANNFTNHLMARAGEFLEQQGLDPTWLLPLLKETLHKLEHTPAREAQTGPARRNDQNIIAAHLQLLSGSPDLKNLYRSISDSIIAFYSKEQT